METYQTYLATHPNPIADLTGEELQATIEQWFKYRYLGFESEDKFTDIFRRNISVNMPIYRQKLRIEPGVSSYDWLVQDYRERQLKTEGNTTGKTTHGQDVTSRTTSGTSGQTTTYGGTDTAVRTGSQTQTHTETDTATHTGTDTTTNTGTVKTENSNTQNTQSLEGKHTVKDTDVAGLSTTTVSPHVERVTKHGGHVSGWSGNSQITANLPMSKSYEGTKIGEGNDIPEIEESGGGYQHAYQHMPALNWDTASAQSQDGHRQYTLDKTTVTEGYNYNDDGQGDITTTQGDKDNPTTKESVRQGDSENKDITEVTGSGSNTVTDDKTAQNIKDLSDTSTHNGENELTYNSITDTRTKGGQDEIKGTTSGTDNATTTYGNIDTIGSDNRTDREQVTGRNEAPADILIRAQAFIEQSSAFKWLKEQLDSCFYPGYYTNEDEEGSAFI